jgi:hypothetical protein
MLTPLFHTRHRQLLGIPEPRPLKLKPDGASHGVPMRNFLPGVAE